MIWDKIRRFLLIWGCIVVGLVLASVIVYREELYAAISGSFTSMLSGYLYIALMVGLMIVLLRNIFR